ncbi:hypothetical protein N007_13025 [Alicyclobacillus acidoterrestris ATCC 49025]|nr:hypothetical protein N007_13025 [Alicyclobacillus acidoterrestris ATCC 49025]
MKPVYLVKPSIAYRNAYLSFYEEWSRSGEPMIPWVITKDPSDFEGMVQFLLESERGESLPEGWVPGSTYWLVDDEPTVIGVVNIRHWLTEQLAQSGGHIGYGIRPSRRRQGYATKLLALSLDKARELGIDRVLLVCDESNVASKKDYTKSWRNSGYELR